MVDSSGNFIHPTSIIEGDVVMGTGNYIGPFTFLSGPITMGNNNWIGSHARIGAQPEVKSLNHTLEQEPENYFGVSFGDNVVVREGAQIHQGWKRKTVIGSGAFIMNQSYIAHDCQIGENVVLASSVLLAGNVTIGSLANLGLGTTVHQGLIIGSLAMVGMSSVITKNIPAFAKCYGSPARVHGVNLIGMERVGILENDAGLISEIFAENSINQSISRELLSRLPSNLVSTFEII